MKSVDSPATQDIAPGGTATFSYSVALTATPNDINFETTGTITVPNPNSDYLAYSSVTETDSNGATCTVSTGTDTTYDNSFSPSGGSIPPYDSVNFPFQCYLGYNPGSGFDTATVGYPTQMTGGLLLTESSSSSSAQYYSGSPTAYQDDMVTVTDSLAGTLGSCDALAGQCTFAYSYSFSGVSGTCTSYPNMASFYTDTTGTSGSTTQTVSVCVGQDIILSETTNPSATWSIDKAVVGTSQATIPYGSTASFAYAIGVDSDSWTVTGTIAVQNPNDWEGITTTVTDSVDDGGICSVTGGMSVYVPASGEVYLPYSCTYASYPPSASGSNTVTAAWDAPSYFTQDGSTSSIAGFTFPSVTVTDTPSGGSAAILGTCDVTGPCTFADTFTTGGVGGACTSYTNTATIVDTGQSSQVTVQVCVGEDPTVTSTADAAFTRTYEWTISKSVSQSSQTIVVGTTATFSYSVSVGETGFADSAWIVTGTITVGNPNNWETIILSSTPTDVVNNGGVCTVTGSTLTMPEGGSISFSYACAYSSAPTPASGTDTATATWNGGTYFTQDASAEGTAGLTFNSGTTGNPSRVYQAIGVTDSFEGSLGALTATDSEPFASQVFTYSRTIGFGTPTTCSSYANTAIISQTGQTSSVSVSVCTIKATPTLSTQVSPSTVALGGSAADTATLSNGYQTTGSITFTAYSNPGCTVQVFSSTVSDSGSQVTSGSFTPGSVGTYYWVATYTGDSNNNPAVSACGAAGETLAVYDFVVTLSPSSTTLPEGGSTPLITVAVDWAPGSPDIPVTVSLTLSGMPIGVIASGFPSSLPIGGSQSFVLQQQGTEGGVSYISCPEVSSSGGQNLQGADLADCNLTGYNLKGDNLQQANLVGADLQGANLAGANLQSADLAGADTIGTDFQGANLQGADLSSGASTGSFVLTATGTSGSDSHSGTSEITETGVGAPDDLAGDNFAGTNLQSANLAGDVCTGANFLGANLQSANLGGVSCAYADFAGANLQQAELGQGAFNYANFTGATLQQSDLSYGSFEYANFTGASSQQANLTGANFTGAIDAP